MRAMPPFAWPVLVVAVTVMFALVFYGRKLTRGLGADALMTQAEVDELSRQIAQRPDDAGLYRQRGEARLALATPKGVDLYLGTTLPSRSPLVTGAEDDFAKAAELAPSSINKANFARIKLIRLLPELKILASLDEVTVAVSRAAERAQWRTEVAANSAQLQAALTWTKKFRAERPAEPSALVRESQLLYLVGSREQAYALLDGLIQQGQKTKPDPSPGKDGVGYPDLVRQVYVRCAYRLFDGDRKGALADATEAVNLWPFYADVFVNRAYVAHHFGELAQAQADLEEAKRLRPNWAEQYRTLQDLFAKK